jgi:hypothetical protein
VNDSYTHEGQVADVRQGAARPMPPRRSFGRLNPNLETSVSV